MTIKKFVFFALIFTIIILLFRKESINILNKYFFEQSFIYDRGYWIKNDNLNPKLVFLGSSMTRHTIIPDIIAKNSNLKQGDIVNLGMNSATPYEMYYEYSEAVNKIPPHRILAINRGEKEKILSVKITVNEDKIVQYLENQILKKNSVLDEKLKLAIKDSLKRLIYPSIDEGFGIPPIEAMASGTPVIVSDIPVFHEVLGDAAIYVEPENLDSWRKAFPVLQKNSHECVKRGKEQIKLYDEANMSRMIAEWLKKVS